MGAQTVEARMRAVQDLRFFEPAREGKSWTSTSEHRDLKRTVQIVPADRRSALSLS